MSIRFPYLNIDLGFVGRSVSVFGFDFTFYGLLIMAGMLLGVVHIVLRARRQDEDQNLCLGMVIAALIGGILGARLLYVGFHWKEFAGQPWQILLDTRSGGLSIYGGLLGGTFFGWFYAKIRGASFGRLADTASMGLLIGQIIGVWGNFFNRESFGQYTDSLFAMQIPVNAVSENQVTGQMTAHLAVAGDTSYIQVHPLFLYQSLWFLLVFVILAAFRRRRKFMGEIFLLYLSFFCLGSVGVEWLRTDPLYRIPGTEISVFLPAAAALFMIFTATAIVKHMLWKRRERLRQPSRREEYHAEEDTDTLSSDPQPDQPVDQPLPTESGNTLHQPGTESSDQLSAEPTSFGQTSSEPGTFGQTSPESGISGQTPEGPIPSEQTSPEPNPSVHSSEESGNPNQPTLEKTPESGAPAQTSPAPDSAPTESPDPAPIPPADPPSPQTPEKPPQTEPEGAEPDKPAEMPENKPEDGQTDRTITE